jgi:uncharacterized membrane-anchored protein YjiN (DUF445 family)
MAQLSVAESARYRTAGDRLAALKRMRLVATGLLLLMLGAFVVCWMFEAQLPWLAYPRAFAEAGMVGACADWFAIVALFRHPLGLPIPHTAIIPRNKQRLGDSLGAFIARNFFAPAEISGRFDRIDIADWVAQWLKKPENVSLVVRASKRVLPPALELIGGARVRGLSRDLIRTGIDSIAAAPLAGRVIAVLVAQGQHLAIFDLGLEAAIDFLGNNRKTLRQKAAANASGWLPGWVDAKLADAFIDALIDTLSAARAADHPWREDYRAYLDRLIGRLADDPEIYERCERVKSGVLDGKLVDDYLAWLTTEIETNLAAGFEEDGVGIGGILERSVPALGTWLDSDSRARDAINLWVRQLVLNTIVPNRDEIGAFVSDVIARWDERTLVERLELQVGRDLQFIRINGTLVGGLVGLILYTLTRALG